VAHQQQIDFCESVKRNLPHFFSDRLVLDIGSLDINGNNQYLFETCLYLGVDLLPGRNVDLASKGHELNLPDESVDVTISTECFEHDQFYALTLENIVRMLKPGGLFLFSCASTGRPEHGTRRTTPQDAPFTQEFGEWSEYYKNLEESDIRRVLDIETLFERHAFSSNQESRDLYFWGVKKGTFINRYDYSFQVHQSDLRSILKAREGFVAELLESIRKRDEHIANLNQVVAERNEQIANLNQAVAERDRQIARSN
jgi:SAM-dependent methyltransferase